METFQTETDHEGKAWSAGPIVPFLLSLPVHVMHTTKSAHKNERVEPRNAHYCAGGDERWRTGNEANLTCTHYCPYVSYPDPFQKNRVFQKGLGTRLMYPDFN